MSVLIDRSLAKDLTTDNSDRDETETVITDPSPYGIVAYLRIKSATLVDRLKPQSEEDEIIIPDLLDAEALEIKEIVETSVDKEVLVDGLDVGTMTLEDKKQEILPANVSMRGDWFSIGNVHGLSSTVTVEESLESEVNAMFQSLIRESCFLSGLSFQYNSC